MNTKQKEPNTYFFFQVEDNVRMQFEDLCSKKGKTVASAIRMFITEMIQVGEMPFLVKACLRDTNAQKDVSKHTRITINMKWEMQNQFTDVCEKIGITRSDAGRMYISRCLENKTLTPWSNKED